MIKILVVDDEKNIRITLGEFLSMQGYSVRSAENADTALELLETDGADIVFTDIIMPKRSGIDLAAAIHKQYPNTQVIIMTGEPTIDTAVEAVRLGARDYMTKPICKDELLKVTRQTVAYKLLLDNKLELERENRAYQDNLEQLVEERTKKLHQSMLNTAYAMGAMMDLRDPYTAGHQRRVGEISKQIGKEMELPEHSVQGLYLTGCIHDIGKIMVPSDILNKPGGLSSPEFEIIKEHAKSGYNVLKDFEMPWPVAEIIRQHHERFNGSGYPRGLKADEIMAEAGIIAVADVVEAMMSHRPYRPGLGKEAALREIEAGRGTLYHPQAADACLKLFREDGFSLEQSV